MSHPIEENPYQSPTAPGSRSQPLKRRRPRPGLILAAFLWALVMLLAIPALCAPRHGPIRQPIEFQFITTFITGLALAGLARSVSGWRHILVAPLWFILIFLEYCAWIWPKKPW